MLVKRSRAIPTISRRSASFASLDGEETDAAALKCSVWDVTFQRGDGVFEVCRIVKHSNHIPKPRCLSLHLDRLERSAAAIDLPLPPRHELEQWIRHRFSNGRRRNCTVHGDSWRWFSRDMVTTCQIYTHHPPHSSCGNHFRHNQNGIVYYQCVLRGILLDT